MKQCSECEEWKDFGEFHKDKSSKDNLHHRCKECKNNSSRECASSQEFIDNQIKFQQENTHKICSDCCLNKPLSDFNKNKGKSTGLSHNCKLCGSLSDKRRKSSQEYLDNQIKFQQENTHKVCTKCILSKSLSEFNKNKGSVTGLTCECKLCGNLSNKKYKSSQEYLDNQIKFQQENTHKACTGCNLNKLLYEFNKSSNTSTGLSDNCKDCVREYVLNPKNKKRKNERTKKRKIKNPSVRLSDSMSRVIRSSLKGNKNGRHWESLVHYTQEQLRDNLISKFQTGMTMENYGKNGWHIDHIIPIRYKNPDGSYYWNQNELADPNSETFRKCWNLDNLQPMWAEDNIKKGNRFIGKRIVLLNTKPL